ncbi:MAG: hypothetical protein AAGI13_03085, partial [Pseudomonadota bacterium]
MPEVSPTFITSQIDGTNGFTINGEQSGQSFGRSVAGAGDVNGDGFVDIVIGAPYTDVAGSIDDRGRVYVIFGGASLVQIDGADGASDGIIDVTQIDGTNGFKIDGVADRDRIGGSVDAAGDVNGDGTGDLLIGGGDIGGPGKAYLIFGRETGFAETISPEVTGGGSLSLVFENAGPNSDDRLGFSVSGAGDIDNDGFDDILLGAPSADPLSAQANASEGAAYLVLGNPAELDELDNDDGLINGFLSLANLAGNGTVFSSGDGANDLVGFAVSELGDINGDGFGDFAVGASRDDPNSGAGNASEGRLHVIFGRADTLPDLRNSGQETGLSGFTIAGLQDRDQLGRSVAGGGDVNGDGFDDFIVGAPYADNPFDQDSGEAYLVFGKQQFRREVLVGQLDGTDGFKLQG